MGTSITQGAIVPATEQPAGTFTPEQIDIIKNSVAKGVSDQELAYFLEVCRSTGLNPLHRQIYAIMRKSKDESGKWTERMTIQTGIDGYRLLATRSRRHAGTDDAVFDTESAPHPAKATVTVYRLVGGQRCAFTATARWDEYVQTRKENGQEVVSGMWGKMPYLLLGKCAEALALRKAFPAETSGIYTHEEMTQADVEQMQPVSKQMVTEVTEEAQSRLLAMSPAEVKERIQEFQEIVDSTNPMAVQHIPVVPTAQDWDRLRINAFQKKMVTSIAQWEKLLEQTGADYEETLAKVNKFGQDLRALNSPKSRVGVH